MSDEEERYCICVQEQITALCDYLGVEIRGNFKTGFECKSIAEWKKQDDEDLTRTMKALKELKKAKEKYEKS